MKLARLVLFFLIAYISLAGDAQNWVPTLMADSATVQKHKSDCDAARHRLTWLADNDTGSSIDIIFFEDSGDNALPVRPGEPGLRRLSTLRFHRSGKVEILSTKPNGDAVWIKEKEEKRQ